MKEDKFGNLSMDLSVDVLQLTKELRALHKNTISYHLVKSTVDEHINSIVSVYRLPSFSQFLSIDESNYWNYVTSTDNVWFYKIFQDDSLVATLHLELSDRVLYISIAVFPEFQQKGIGSKILKDIQDGRFELDFYKIEATIDERNTASIALFEKAGFSFVCKEEELLMYEYMNIKTERSCGAVVFTVTGDRIKYLIVQSHKGIFGFPKGHMEDDETEKETALREIYEETGVNAELIDGFKTEETYTFESDGELIKKRVVYYLARYENQFVRVLKDDVHEVSLLDFDLAMRALQFKSSRKILYEANTFIKSMGVEND